MNAGPSIRFQHIHFDELAGKLMMLEGRYGYIKLLHPDGAWSSSRKQWSYGSPAAGSPCCIAGGAGLPAAGSPCCIAGGARGARSARAGGPECPGGGTSGALRDGRDPGNWIYAVVLRTMFRSGMPEPIDMGDELLGDHIEAILYLGFVLGVQECREYAEVFSDICVLMEHIRLWQQSMHFDCYSRTMASLML